MCFTVSYNIMDMYKLRAIVHDFSDKIKIRFMRELSSTNSSHATTTTRDKTKQYKLLISIYLMLN